MSTSILRDNRRDARIIAPDMGDSDSGSSYAGSDGSLEAEQFQEEVSYASRGRNLSAEDPQAEVSSFEGRSIQDGARSAAQGLAQASGSQESLLQSSDTLPILRYSGNLGVSMDQLDSPERMDEQLGYQSRPQGTEWIAQGRVPSGAQGELLSSVLAPSFSQEQNNEILGIDDSTSPPRMTGETAGVAQLHARRPTTIYNRANDTHLQSTSILRPADITVLAGSRSAPRSSRDVGNIMLPRWQPDAEVTYCPICRTQFSFFVRKHHCRKCGRVVCNSCSPHRITIPYQYIVQPPPPIPAPSPMALRPAIDSRNSEGTIVSDDRDGGTKVRLCNPCVPDPNTLPPQPQGNDGWRAPSSSYYINSRNRPLSYNEEAINAFPGDGDFGRYHSRGISATSGDWRQQYISAPSHHPHSTNLTLSSYPNTPAHTPGSGQQRLDSQSSSRPSHSTTYLSPDQRSQSRGHTGRHQSLTSFHSGSSILGPQSHYRSLLDVGVDRMPQNNERPLPPIPRIREEDECPICHNELPSQNLPDFENLRATHITQCINNQIALHSGHVARPSSYASQSQLGTSSPSSSTITPLVTSHTPNSIAQVSSSLLPLFPASVPNTPEGRMAAREQAHAAVVLGSSNRHLSPLRRTGMFLYTASEKDCVDDAECTVCLEEFEPGASMARLECFCRFHKHCIQAWFVDHPGRCPVHQHDGYGF